MTNTTNNALDHDTTLAELAEAAGIAVQWIDVNGNRQTVSDLSLQKILSALQFPCDDVEQRSASYARIKEALRVQKLPPLITGQTDEAVQLAAQPELYGQPYHLQLESGAVIEGVLSSDTQIGLRMPPVAEMGYHKLRIAGQEITLAIAPPRCFGVEDIAHQGALEKLDHASKDSYQEARRLWGLSAQIYSLRHAHDGGIGDFSGIRSLSQHAVQYGADLLAISPVHAMFAADPDRFSPYSPSSRLFLNVLHIDATALYGEAVLLEILAELGAPAQEEWQKLSELALIDWPHAARLKLRVLRHLYGRFVDQVSDISDKHLAFQTFRLHGGEALEAHARYEALHSAFDSSRNHSGWREWPPEYHNPNSATVTAFAQEHRAEVDFHLFLQWQAASGLIAAQASAREAGMLVGLIADLAVGADNGGSQSWTRQDEIIVGVSVGAPPDWFNAAGQGWGLGAFSPHALRDHGYRAYIEMLRAAFAHAGGVRIDHVLGLSRLWLIPDGMSASEGAYVTYPIDDLLRLIALESWRYRAIVIGEDLGVVPDRFREHLTLHHLMGIQVLWFQQQHGEFIPPKDWHIGAIATTGTHDLPTICGWWRGNDINWRERAGIINANGAEQEHQQRERERQALWRALKQAGLSADNSQSEAPDRSTPPIKEIIHYLSSTTASVAILPIEDALGLVEQVNLPGTSDQHPNWRRRMEGDVNELLTPDDVAERLWRMKR